MAFLPSTALERDATQEEQLLVDAADFLCLFGAGYFESTTVESNQYINIIQVMIRWDLSLSMSVLHFWVVQAVPGLVQEGWNKADRGQWIFLRKYSLLGSGSWHARLCSNAIAAVLLGISFPLVYPLTQAPRCPCPQTSFVASPQPNGNNSGN